MAKGVADFTGIPGLIHDMSNTLSNDDPWYVDGLNLVKNVAKIGTTPVRGAVKGLFYVGEKSYEAGGVVREKMVESLLDTPLMYNKYKNPGESYENYLTRVASNKEQISLGQASLALLSPGKNAADRSGWFADALDNNLAFLSGGFDIFDANDRKVAFDDQFTGKFLSGTQDLIASTVIDPLTFTGFLGKGAVIASKGLMYENINGKLARAVFGKVAMTPEKMDNLLERAIKGEGAAVKDIEFLAQTDAKGQYGYWAKKKVTNPDALAYMFGKAQTKEEVVATFRAVMLKDTKAMSEIAEKDSEFALIFDNITDGPTHPQRQLMDGKLDGDVLTTPEYNNAMGSYIEDLKKTDPAFLASYEMVATGRPFRYGFEKEFLQNSRFGAVTKAEKMAARTFGDSESITYLKTSLHPLVKIVHFFKEEVPSGVFSVNDGNSYMEFNTFLRQTNDLSGNKFQEASRELADRYLGAASPADRLDIIKEAERRAINTLFPNYDQVTLDKIYKIYDARRASLIERHNNQGFLGYFDGDQFVNAKSPLLEREQANTVIIADLARLKQGVDAHERILPTVLQGIDVDNLAIRTQKSMAALDTINDIFKTSVLMRLGYTVRNLTEAQLSMMAKGFALPSAVASGGTAAVGRFFNNRKAGVNRIIDNVNVVTGKTDDVNVIQNEISSQFDMLRSVDMGRQQLAKEVATRIAEIEGMRVGKTVRGFTQAITSDITGEASITVAQAEKAAFEVELRTLKGVLADLESITVYHGSPNAFELDKTRALAASASPGVARKYAEGGIIQSVEQYIPTPTGRPGRLGQKPTPEGGTLPSEKRADVLNEATLRLQSDMIDAVNAGKLVEYKDSAGQWKKVKSIDYETLVLAADTDEAEIVLFKNWSNRPIFRVNATKGNVQPYRVYGKPLYLQQWSDIPLELRDAAFSGKITNFKSWIKTKGWKDSNDPVFKYMRENGYGRAVVIDDQRAGGVSQIALPESIGDKGRTAEVNAYIKSRMEKEAQVWDMDATAGLEPRLDTPKARRAAKRMVGKQARLQKKDYAVSPYYTEDSVNAMINNGVEDAAANLARDYAQSHAHLDDLFSRLGAVVDRAETTAIKQRTGYGTLEVDSKGNVKKRFNNKFDANGVSYTLPKAFEEASWFLGRTSAESTWNALVSSQEMAFMAGIGSRSVRTIDPADPKYFEGWANILNMHFRDPESGIMDPVVRRILDGEDNQKILNWFRTSKGAMYATEAYTLVGAGKGVTKLKGGELDEHLMAKLHETRQAVASYIPDNETALMLSAAKETGKPLSGGEVQQFLVERFGKNPENLKPLNGMLVTSSKEYKDQERIIDTINRRVMRFLGSMPEDTFARHPMVTMVYEKELRLNIAAMADAKGVDRLTPDEINRAVSNARETARQEVERTLFTIVRRTGASSSRSMKLLFPFYAAYENTLKRWGGMAMDNPQLVATAARTIAQVVNAQTIVDRDGNRLTSAEQLQGSQGASLVVNVPQSFINALPSSWKPVVENSFKSISIPLQSLDVITQGQPGNPGFGPYATLPAYLILSQRPELEDAFKPFFPVGSPQSAVDIFTPSAVRRLATVWRQDELYVRSYNQMLRYETYLYNQGKRTDAPTPTEIKDKTNKFFFLRALTSISAPFAIAPEVDFYAQTFRQYQTQYADYRDPTTGERVYGMAEAKFLEQYPDFFEATVSLSKNEGGLEPSIQTVRNLRKHSDLMAYAEGKGNPELMGFLADDGDNAYTFSQAAYQWQYNKGATPGGGSTYRQNRTPGELLREANIKRGWAEYQQLEQAINAYKIQNGIADDSDPEMDVVKQAKSIWIQQKAGDNLDWYSEYVSPDRAKYARRVDVLEKALKDKKWMAQNGDRAVVKSMALYLEARSQIAEILKQRDAAGGSRSIDANSNADVAAAFDMFRTNLIAGSPEFEQFINRYFSNDTVVI
jgi:hypothetical protein